ncbi:hypothetical protein Cgig2_015184 [Carnegiea gigantea]|uniref:RING-type domain-containing protein n=1 Tax=Carnegiea gigantea TaxID=171969 RepID=A0A9Q1KNI7_9CARY|nr:hypothetical protein Cgig2_015184 [Carnegiea gigantea]
MGFDESDVSEDAGGGGKSLSTSDVSCSICLEPVIDNGDRSWAKLQCGHEFHLDCIGSAFNTKGAMQCPNCRKIEKGQWLFATSSHSVTEISFEDWPQDEDLYDLGYSEMCLGHAVEFVGWCPQMSFGVQWCPITAFPQLPSSFEDGEFPSTAYHDPLGEHAVFAEHTAVPSSTHPCPYLSYYGPIHSLSSSSVGSVAGGSNFSSHWGGPSGSSEMPTFSVTAMDPHYHNWEHHSLSFLASGTRLGGPDQPSAPSVTQRSSRANSDSPRSGSFIDPSILSHSSSAHFASSAPYPGSVARARDRDRDRAQALQAYFQPPSASPPMHAPVMISTSRTNGHLGLSQVGPLLTSSNETASFCVFPTATSSRNYPEIENPMTSQFQTWERDRPTNFLLNPREGDSSWGPRGGFHPPTGGSGGFRQWHWSSQNRS